MQDIYVCIISASTGGDNAKYETTSAYTYVYTWCLRLQRDDLRVQFT